MKRPTVSMVLAVLLSSLLALAFAGCGREGFSCTLDSLLLQTASLPGDGWQEVGSRDERAAPSRLGIERIGTSFVARDGGGVLHIIYRFADEDEAVSEYPELSENWFLLMPEGTVCRPHPVLAASAPSTSEATTGCCTAPDGHERCLLVARYGPDVVEFAADMTSVDIDQLAGIFEKLDAKMAECVRE